MGLKSLTFLAAALFGLASTATAQVDLTANDGSIRIRGELVSFADGQYVVDTVIGRFTINAASVTCEGAECPEIDPLEQVIRIGGTDFLLDSLLPRLTDDYALANGAEVRTVVTDDSRVAIDMVRGDDLLATFESAPSVPALAFQALLEGELEMVISDRRITNAEIDRFLDAGLGDLTTVARETIIAQDGAMALVSQENQVPRLTLDDLAGILSGEITNWSEVRGPDAPINLYLPREDTALARTFQDALLDPAFLSYASGAETTSDLSELSDMIASDPYGIGLATMSTQRGAEPMRLTATCGMPVRQDGFAIKSEDYPFARRVYLYTANREMPSRTEKFIRFATQLSGEQGLSGTGLFGLTAEVSEVGDHGAQLAYALSDPTQAGEIQGLRNFVNTVLGGERLSVTFRFGSGSSQLDNKALADAERLASLINEERFRDREVLLVGFTDSIGNPNVNRVLSLRRAQQVLEVVSEVGESDVNRIRPLGFGAANPVACNTSEAGRELNRRVEVWLR
ncbi:MAG: phosphate ABC transporter substrate-binding/OmpA family protein [Pseudomonadota bacterium]